MNPEVMLANGFSHELSFIRAGKCPFCKQLVKGFKDALSFQEHQVSGLCQNCQDGFFSDHPGREFRTDRRIIFVNTAHEKSSVYPS